MIRRCRGRSQNDEHRRIVVPIRYGDSRARLLEGPLGELSPLLTTNDFVVQRFPVEEHRSCRGSLKNTKLFPWARNSGEITPPELTGVSRNGVQEKYTFPQLCTSFRRKRTAPRAPASKTGSIHSRGEPLAASWTRINEIWLGGQTYGEESSTFKNMDS